MATRLGETGRFSEPASAIQALAGSEKRKTMKYFLYLSIFLSIAADSAVALAQSSRSGRDQSLKRVIDTCVLRVDYLFVRAVDTVSGQRYRDHRRLEIGSRYSRDYSLFADRSDSLAFEAYRKNADAGVDLYGWLRPGERGFCEDYYMDYPRRELLTASLCIVNTEYRYNEPIPRIDWTLHADTTHRILGYTCQRATAEFRGRRWSVWFTPEIPLTRGPWKLGGLPGLILQACDETGLFGFEATGVELGRNHPIHIYDEKAQPSGGGSGMQIRQTTRDRVRMLQSLFWKDPVALNEMHGVVSAIRDASGRTVIQKRGAVQRPYIPPLELE